MFKRQKSLVMLACLVAVGVGCDERMLPAVAAPDAGTPKPDVAAAKPEPAFAEPPIARYNPAQPRTPTQHAADQAKIKNGEMFNALQALPEVKTVSQRVADDVVISKTQMQVPLAGNEALLDLKPGAVLTGAAARAARRQGNKGENAFGFMRKVKSVKQVGDSVVIETTHAKLYEVFAGAVNLSADLTAAEDADLTGIDLREFIPGLATDYQPPTESRGGIDQKKGPLGSDGMLVGNQYKVGGEHSWPIDMVSKVGGVDVTVEGELKVKALLEAAVGIGYGFDINANIFDGGPELNYVNVWAGGEFHAEAGIWLQTAAKGDAIGEALDKALELAQIDNPFKPEIPTDFTLGTMTKKGPTLVVVPTTFYIEFLASCKPHLSSSVTATANAGVLGEVKYGFEWTKKNKFQPIQKMEFKKWQEFKVSDGNLTATVECWIGPRVHWLIADIAGPYIEADAGVRGTLAYEATCAKPNTLAQSGHPPASLSVLVEIGLRGLLGGSVNIVVDKESLWDYDFGNISRTHSPPPA